MATFNFSKNSLYSALIEKALNENFSLTVVARDKSKTEIDSNVIIDFFENEIDLNTKKYNSKSNKPNAKQKENEIIKEKIVEYLNEVEIPVTISQIVKHFDNEYSIPKISALVKQLKDSGVVNRTEIKRVAYFELA